MGGGHHGSFGVVEFDSSVLSQLTMHQLNSEAETSGRPGLRATDDAATALLAPLAVAGYTDGNQISEGVR